MKSYKLFAHAFVIISITINPGNLLSETKLNKTVKEIHIEGNMHIDDIAVSSGKKYFTAIDNKTNNIYIYNLKERKTTVFHKSGLKHPILISGKILLAKNSTYGQFVAYNLEADKEVSQFGFFQQPISTFKISNNKKYIFAGGDHELGKWKFTGKRVDNKYVMEQSKIHDIAISKDDKYVVSAHNDGNIYIRPFDFGSVKKFGGFPKTGTLIFSPNCFS